MVMFMNTVRTNNMSNMIVFALIIRLILIMLGCLIDNISDVKYTDVDYNVFTDASRLMWDGNSPYERDTYRYPPLLAFLLVPNIFFPSFGKILFSLSDVGLLYHYFSMLEMTPAPKIRWVWLSVVWALNLSLAVISTRGSSDSIHNLLILCALRLTFSKKYVLAGSMLGLSIHLRIYPIIFIPAILLHILKPLEKRRSSNSFLGGSAASDVAVACSPPPGKRVVRTTPSGLRRLLDLDPHICQVEYSSGTALDAIRFFVSVSASFFLCTAVAYHYYRWDFLENAVIYHFKRLDSRHNFSPHFYWLYLTGMSTASSGTAALDVSTLLSVMTFLPQMIMFSLVTLSTARRDLSVCLFLLTFTLVSFNKVCTAQYFTWFACFLPAIVRESWALPLKTLSILVTMWTLSLFVWLKGAHSLEFEGRNNFAIVWVGSLIFHICNAMCIVSVLTNSKSMKRR